MSYIVLARKHRPQNFKEIVGQDPVSQTLVHAIEAGRVAHAYVFSGPRGVGKTTIARILAKCLNCEKGITTTPCNQCASCQSISQGQSVEDVLEIDGASNRGIEQIRELRDSAKYTPSSSRYRIFIIDEAHQITKDAFGALLKILEEPPAHVVFMMATTEVQKIPAPILSRCQRFSLKPISPEKLLGHLKKICREEKIKAEEEALSDIVRFVEGSLRDALSLLDQAVVYAEKGITSQTLRELLGLLPRTIVREFAQKLQNADPTEILTAVNQSIKDGIDLTQLGRDIQSYYHDLLLAKAGVEDPLNKDYSTLGADAKSYEFNTLERNIRLLSRMLEEMRRSETPRAVFEIYCLRIAQKLLSPREILERLEKLESGVHQSFKPTGNPASQPALRPTPRPIQDPPPPPPVDRSAPAPSQKTPTPIVPPAAREPMNETSKGGLSATAPGVKVDELAAHWPMLIEQVGKEKHSLASALEEADISFEDGKILLLFQQKFSRDLVQRNETFLKSLLFGQIGVNVSIQTGLKAAADKSAPGNAGPAPTRPQEKTREPGMEFEADKEKLPSHKVYREVAPESLGEDVQKVLKHFPGVFKKEK